MIKIIPDKFISKVRYISDNELQIENLNLDYNFDLYRESTGNKSTALNDYSKFTDAEDVYKQNFLNEIDEEYAKKAAKENMKKTKVQ